MSRLDQWLVEQGHFPSRERACLAIMAGEVEIEGKGSRLKPGTKLGPRDRVIIKSKPRFVSRGGDKLDGVLDRWNINVHGMEVLDIGASTGGFSHCLLERGAARVICLDVGKGQLHWDLRRDPRVTVMEGVNIRYLDARDLPFKPQVVTVDLAFISLHLVFPVMAEILEEGRELFALIKPQFEAAKGKVGRGGVVRDRDVHSEVLRQATQSAVAAGFVLLGLAPSPLKGADGNIEFFGWWVRSEAGADMEKSAWIEEAVREAWEER
jgi:23S rRNA (cytidine1920-2'-O)/16S rRNA (cytidine1409-2'-O)-methyltransferase